MSLDQYNGGNNAVTSNGTGFYRSLVLGLAQTASAVALYPAVAWAINEPKFWYVPLADLAIFVGLTWYNRESTH